MCVRVLGGGTDEQGVQLRAFYGATDFTPIVLISCISNGKGGMRRKKGTEEEREGGNTAGTGIVCLSP